MEWYRLTDNAATQLKEQFGRELFYEDGLPRTDEGPVRLIKRKSYWRLEVDKEAPIGKLRRALEKGIDFGGMGGLTDPGKDKGAAVVYRRVLDELENDFRVAASEFGVFKDKASGAVPPPLRPIIKDLRDAEKPHAYLKSNFRNLGIGVGRSVYRLPSGWVLKYAPGDPSQNEWEWKWSQKTTSPYFAPVLTDVHGEDFKWIIQVETEAFDPSVFEREFGVTWQTFTDWLTHMAYGRDHGEPPRRLEIVEDIQEWASFSGVLGDGIADLRHPKQWGIWKNIPVIVDYGGW